MKHTKESLHYPRIFIYRSKGPWGLWFATWRDRAPKQPSDRFTTTTPHDWDYDLAKLHKRATKAVQDVLTEVP